MSLNTVLCLVLLSFFVSSAHSVDLYDLLLKGTYKFIDLSHPINNDTIAFPGGRKFSFTKKIAGVDEQGMWYSVNEFCSAEHSGTHMDAPYHFGADKYTIGQIPFKHLFTALKVIDLSKLVNGDPNFVLQKHHMDNLFYLDPKKKYTVLFRFGWSQYYNDPTKYLGAHAPTTHNLNFPGIGEEVANWIAESPNLVGVGLDTPSVDPGSSTTYPAHIAFSQHGIFNLENVKIDKELPNDLCVLVVMPMKIHDGTGAPVRITAICPRTGADFEPNTTDNNEF